jgi:hypothetical protein
MKEEGGRVYRIRADCVHGTVTDTDGESYRYAGIWPEGFGKGRSRWRDSSGHVVATTEVANGLALSAIGALLCPAGFGTAAAARRPR